MWGESYPSPYEAPEVDGVSVAGTSMWGESYPSPYLLP